MNRENINLQVGTNIKHARKLQNVTLAELAERVGISESTMQRYESGIIRGVSVNMIERLADALRVSPTELTGWSEEVDKPADIQDELTKLIQQLDPSSEITFLNGTQEMDDKTRQFMLKSLRNTLELSQLLAEKNECK